MIKSLFFIFCCIMPCAAEAGEILNVQDGFKIAKAVKLGRGNAYSVSANAHLNIGKTEIAKECDSNCIASENSCPLGKTYMNKLPCKSLGSNSAITSGCYSGDSDFSDSCTTSESCSSRICAPCIHNGKTQGNTLSKKTRREIPALFL